MISCDGSTNFARVFSSVCRLSEQADRQKRIDAQHRATYCKKPWLVNQRIYHDTRGQSINDSPRRSQEENEHGKKQQ
jgi:hypothetical protein